MNPDTRELSDRGPFAAFDVEDDSQGGILQICTMEECADGSTITRHLSPTREAWWAWALSLGKEYTIFAHNLEYDAGHVIAGREASCVPVLGGGGSLIGINLNGGPKLRCTFNHFRQSLAKVGDMLGLEKLRFDPESRDYVERDVEITLRAAQYLAQFYRSVNANFGATSSGATLSQFVRNYLDRAQPLPPWLDYQREGYYGGRTECFRVGEYKDVYEADINSSYGYILANYDYPDTATAEISDDIGIEDEGVAQATVDIPRDIHRPPLPFRTAAGNIYPVGKVTGTWALPELRYAAELGAKIKLWGGVKYSESFKPFRGFVEEHYKVKSSTDDPAERYFRKLLVNSLYGMFGLSPERKVYTTDTDREGVGWGRGNIIEVINYAPFANQVWAIYTTAYARLRLARFMDETENSGGRILYCDTDSVFYQADCELWPESDNLGDLSSEGCADMTIRAPKCYAWGDTVRVKGIPRAERRHLDGEIKVFKTPRRYLQAIKKHEAANIWTETSRQISGHYNRRDVNSDGSTRPLLINGRTKARN